MVEKRNYDRLVERIGALAGRVAELCRRQDKTLQRYRERGLLPCTQIRHKVYYKTADVERLLAASALRSGSKR